MPDNHLDPGNPHPWRNVADFAAILVGMSLIGLALYGGPLIDRGPGSGIRDRDVGGVWTLTLVTGAMAVVAVGLAQSIRWRPFGRALIMIAGVLLLGGLAFFSIGWRASPMFVLPAILLIGLSRRIGPIDVPSLNQPARKSGSPKEE